jgi:hypothetical protein
MTSPTPATVPQARANLSPSHRVYKFASRQHVHGKDTCRMKTARTRVFLALPAALVAAALFATPSSAATPISGASVSLEPTVAPAPTTQGIIMSDGRICNPRWGC